MISLWYEGYPAVEQRRISLKTLQVKELGQILLNFARTVPGGLVVFLPSYKMLHNAMKVWKESKLYNNLNVKKKVCLLLEVNINI